MDKARAHYEKAMELSRGKDPVREKISRVKIVDVLDRLVNLPQKEIDDYTKKLNYWSLYKHLNDLRAKTHELAERTNYGRWIQRILPNVPAELR